MPDPLVLEDFPPSPAITGTSFRRSRGFWVYAASDTEALVVLRQQKNVFRGCVYEDHQGGRFDQYLICTEILTQPLTPVPVGGIGLYRAEAYYGYATLIYDEPARPPDLTVRRWIETAEELVYSDFDIAGAAIANTAQQPFEPGMPKYIDRETRVIEWHKFAVSFDVAYDPKRVYRKRLNSGLYDGAPPHSLLCRNVTCEEVPIPSVDGSTFLFRLRAYLEFRESVRDPGGTLQSGWDTIRLNFGTRLRNVVSGQFQGYIPITSDQADPNAPIVNTPVLLSNDGRSILSDGATPTFRVFRAYDDIDFSGLVA